MAETRNVGQPIRWLTVDAIRKQQRMRREAVEAAMLSGELPYEQRGPAGLLPRLQFVKQMR